MTAKLIFRSQIECVPLQVHILHSVLCVHRKEIPGDGRFAVYYFLMATPLMHGFPESTALSCSLADQGIKIRIRKDIRQRKPRSGMTNFPITNGQPLGPGIPIQDEESDRESEVRHEDHSDTTNNHNSLSNVTSKPSSSRKRPE